VAGHLVGEHGCLQVLERADEPAVGRLLPRCPGVPLQAGRGDAAEAREPQDLQVGHRQQVGGLHTRNAAAGDQEEELGRQEATSTVFVLGARPPKSDLEISDERLDLPQPNCKFHRAMVERMGRRIGGSPRVHAGRPLHWDLLRCKGSGLAVERVPGRKQRAYLQRST
jgi:hypothetical protein